MIDLCWLNERERNQFYTIPEVCKLLGLDMDKLRSQCLLHGIFPATYKGILGLDMRSFQIISTALFVERCSAETHDDPWA